MYDLFSFFDEIRCGFVLTKKTEPVTNNPGIFQHFDIADAEPIVPAV